MAWIQTKNNWTSGDIPQDTDFNRIEGNIKELHSKKASLTDAEFTGTVKCSTFTGNATSATKATNDGNNNNIVSTYATKSNPTFTGTVTVNTINIV